MTDSSAQPTSVAKNLTVSHSPNGGGHRLDSMNHSTVSDDIPGRVPKVLELYTVLDDDYVVLPYDPDRVAQDVYDELDSVSNVMTAASIAEVTKNSADVRFPQHVIERAEIAIQSEYYQTDMKVLLHLMDQHAKSIIGKETPQRLESRGISEHVSSPNSRRFNIVRTLRTRTEKAVKHLGQRLKRIGSRSKSHAQALLSTE